MNSQVIGLFAFDQEIFLKIRAIMGSRFLEDHAATWGNIYAWTPLFVFLVILLYLNNPKAAVYSIFLSLGAFVLSYQAASILTNYLAQPAPWKVMYWLTQAELPGFYNGAEIDLPDWQVASMAGCMQFARLRLQSWDSPRIDWLWLAVFLFGLIRIYAGFTYPSGVVLAMLVGAVLGWLIFQLGRNLELIQTPGDADSNTPASDEFTDD